MRNKEVTWRSPYVELAINYQPEMKLAYYNEYNRVLTLALTLTPLILLIY